MLDYLKSVFAFDPGTPLLFTQLQFWVFLVLVYMGFAIATGAKVKPVIRNGYLMFVSLLFYYKTSGLFVGLLLFVTCSDFLIAQGIWRCRQHELATGRVDRRPPGVHLPYLTPSKLLLILSVVIDLSILVYFKYAYFLTDMFNQIFGTDIAVRNIAAEAVNAAVGRPVFSVDRIILPVGISFYTFQVISYTADVYKGQIKPVRNLLDFGFYVSFFPQLVAGPIVKASDFIPQLYKPFHLSRMQFGMATFWILNGLMKKVILSDYLAVNFIDRVFANPRFFSGFENLMALFTYSLQVYADFSGYTDIAIGLSLLMGFYLPKNFNSPYKAPSCQNFWKRWHISLSRWLQTYLYIPLGGNRNITSGTWFWIALLTLSALILSGNPWIGACVALLAITVAVTAWRHPEKRRHIYANMNSMITMLLGGLWHGASCNFLIWGGMNGTGIVIYKFWRDMTIAARLLSAVSVVLGLGLLRSYAPAPLWNVLLVFMIAIAVGESVRCVWYYAMRRSTRQGFKRLSDGAGMCWSVLITFVFITFTRLFFRSGSNLDPAEANETAWRIAREMITAIGSPWTVDVRAVCSAYRYVFLLFLAGMAIHWLPERLKRRYRIWWAKLPLPIMVMATIVVVVIVYQFVTAEMQPFIYFQF